jgi:hypothetical protein
MCVDLVWGEEAISGVRAVRIRETLPYATAPYFRPDHARPGVVIEIEKGEAVRLTAVVASFVCGLPGDGGEGALEKGVIHYVALVVFALDDPVAGKDFALTCIREDDGCVSALFCFYKKGSAGPKGLQLSSPDGVVQPTVLISLLRS